MAKTRAEVLATLRELGLTTDEANAELQARESEAQKLVASASPAARDNALLLARQLVRLEQPLFVTANPDSRSAGAAQEGGNRPGLRLRVPHTVSQATRWLQNTARSGYALWVAGPKWLRALVIAAPITAASVLVFTAVGGFDSAAKPSSATRVAETLGARVDALIPTPVPPPTPEPHVVQVPQYQIAYTLAKKRLDGGKTYYVLIDPVDLSTPFFKDDLKQLVRDFVGQYGAKISIEIHDDQTSLTDSYKRFGEKTAKLPMTTDEGRNEALHFVAAFNGNLDTGMYLNTLQFFSAASADTPTVGKYVEDIDFDPTK